MKRKDYFRDQVIWLTGAAGGLGTALSHACAQRGAKLILSGRNLDRLLALETELKNKYGGEHATLQLDLTNLDELAEKSDRAKNIFGRIDQLIHNAGISQRSLVHETSFEVIEKIMRTNYLGAAALTLHTLPEMYERKSGHVVAISSVMGLFSTPLRSGYCAAKHAIQGFYGSLGHEARRFGVSVTVIIPGWINTDIARNALEGDGSAHGIVDHGQAQAKGPEAFADDIVRAIAKKKFSHYTALNWKTRFAIFVNRYFPWLLRILVRNMNVT